MHNNFVSFLYSGFTFSHTTIENIKPYLTCDVKIFFHYQRVQDQASCNSFYPNPCGVKSIEHLKLLFISLGSPLIALEREKIFELTKNCIMSKKLTLNELVTYDSLTL